MTLGNQVQTLGPRTVFTTQRYSPTDAFSRPCKTREPVSMGRVVKCFLFFQVVQEGEKAVVKKQYRRGGGLFTGLSGLLGLTGEDTLVTFVALLTHELDVSTHVPHIDGL